jgi:hypothetical protein
MYSYACETLKLRIYVTCSKLSESENRVFRRILWPEGDEVTGENRTVRSVIVCSLHQILLRNRGSSVSIVSDYRLDDQGSIPAEVKDFSSSLCGQTRSGAYTASGYRGCHPEGKARPVRHADHSPPSRAEANNVLELHPSPPCPLNGGNGTSLL